MEERQPILSLIYYENELVYSLNCYFVEEDDDLIEITLSQNYIVIGSVKINSKQLKTILIALPNELKTRQTVNMSWCEERPG